MGMSAFIDSRQPTVNGGCELARLVGIECDDAILAVLLSPGIELVPPLGRIAEHQAHVVPRERGINCVVNFSARNRPVGYAPRTHPRTQREGVAVGGTRTQDGCVTADRTVKAKADPCLERNFSRLR